MRFNNTTCRSGKHAWIPENIKVLSCGTRQCRICLNEKNATVRRRRRDEAKRTPEIKLIGQIDLQAKYWPNVLKQQDCWVWTGTKDGAGYGYVTVLSWPVSAHRIAFTITNGAIPDGLEICHRCDVPLCVNPSHLFAGTHADNMRDMRDKGRWHGFQNNRKAI